LLTGKILFRPFKFKDLSRDTDHIYTIMCIFGPFPPDYFPNRTLFYKHNNILKCKKKIKYKSLSNKLQKNLRFSISESELNLILNLMYDLFKYNSDERPDYNELINNNYFNNI